MITKREWRDVITKWLTDQEVTLMDNRSGHDVLEDSDVVLDSLVAKIRYLLRKDQRRRERGNDEGNSLCPKCKAKLSATSTKSKNY